MQRRAFLTAAARVIQAALCAALAIPSLRFLLAPLRRTRDRSVFLRVASLDALQKDRPTRVTVMSDSWDAFTHHPSGPVGDVWLIRASGDTIGQSLRCLHATCPHLGCLVEFSAERGAFQCPCHVSAFDDQGRQLFGPSPRNMDELPVRVSAPDEQGRRWVEVQYQEFQTGVAEARPIA